MRPQSLLATQREPALPRAGVCPPRFLIPLFKFPISNLAFIDRLPPDNPVE